MPDQAKTPPHANLPAGPHRPAPPDPIAFSRKLAEIMQHAQPAMKAAVERMQEEPRIADTPLDPLNIRKPWIDMWFYWAHQPEKLMSLQADYWKLWMDIYTQTTRKFLGAEDAQPVVQPEKGDRRFRDPVWQDNAVFDFLKQSYLLTGHLLNTLLSEADNLDEGEKRRLDFALRQFIDAMAPNNFALTNPEVLKTTLDTGGDNILRGLENLVDDISRGKGQLKISKTDYEAFKVGENLATTQGRVVFRNDLFELIQYHPTTEQVDKTPLLIVPPWINKYYILDMRPDNSLVKWAVDQGLTVFIMSWVNPSAKLASKSFADYMEEGLLTAVRQVQEATGEEKVHTVGYCIGGTLLTTTLAYAKRTKQAKPFASATFLTTLIDFSDAGDLTLFTDDAQLENLDKEMAEKGYLEAGALQQTFNLLRANDLIWSFVVNNYLLGKDPFPFDLLYWNDDSTNMPAAMHSFYLHNMYRRNLLIQKDKLKIKNVPIDIEQIDVPAYFLSTRDDHIAPWLATYAGAKALKNADVTFTLASSGHVAGVVNPPAAKKYSYWTAHKLAKNPEQWLEMAKMQDGSWWPHWRNWLKDINKAQVKARKVPDRKLGDAPGSYVRRKAV